FTIQEESGDEIHLTSDDDEESQAWLSQSADFFKRHGVFLDGDLNQYKLIAPYFWLKGDLTDPQDHRPQPVYFFTQPFSPTAPYNDRMTGDVHYWSLDPDGQIPLSPDTCHRFGLPTELKLSVTWRIHSWSSEVYRLMYKYQIARGFDPSTTDFARSLGRLIFRPANDSDRFEQVGVGKSSTRLCEILFLTIYQLEQMSSLQASGRP
ncbi:hypothetical protein V5O48_017875, partial [Marasmius crinis-equi]